LSRRFSSSSCRRRRSSAIPNPANWRRHRSNVCSVTPNGRQTSTTGVPASARRKAETIGSSENVFLVTLRPPRDAFMLTPEADQVSGLRPLRFVDEVGWGHRRGAGIDIACVVDDPGGMRNGSPVRSARAVPSSNSIDTSPRTM
jgi:hypothetical protein